MFRLTTVVLGALWVLWPFIALAGGLGFSVLTGLAALILLPVVARSLRPRLYFVLLVAFFIYTGVTAMWSPRDQVLVNFDFGKMQFAVRSEMLALIPLRIFPIIICAACSALASPSKPRRRSGWRSEKRTTISWRPRFAMAAN